VRVPSGEPELVRAGAAGDPTAVAALWDAYGPRVFTFCQRMVGRADAAADAAQDAFLLAHAELGSLAASGESFGIAVFGAARTTCYELLARDPGAGGAAGVASGVASGGRAPASSLSAAAARLRQQQRAALALTGLEGLRYAEIAAVLGVGADGVGALLARARLRLHDELHGTALAGTAVRSPDCEDVVPLLAAAADGELAPADASWADPHVERCPTCPRTRRAMDDTAATYAAWSPAVPPGWLGDATLAELGLRAPGAGAAVAAGVAGAGAMAPAAAAAAGRGAPRAAGAWTTPRPRLSAAPLGAALLGVAFAALLLTATGSLRQRDPAAGGVALFDAARSLRVAGVPAKPAPRRAARKRAPHRARRARPSHRPRRAALVPVRAVRRATPAPRPSATRRPQRRPTPAPAPRPKPKTRPSPPAPAPSQPATTTTTVPTAPTPANPNAPADELPGASGSTAAAVPASAVQPPAAPAPQRTATPAPSAASVALPASAADASAPPAVGGGGPDRHRGGHWHGQPARGPGGPCASPRGRRGPGRR
jgi:DNA-directed RNA polymerase specialized sigma24 family protein